MLTQISEILSNLGEDVDAQLFKIDGEQLFLCGQDITNKLLAKKDGFSKEVSLSELDNFKKSIKNSFVRLNHVGISYACSDIEQELSFYKGIIKDSNFSLYEEQSNDPSSKWLFVGSTDDWQSTLFEIVLTKTNPDEYENIWRPHFQIDLDTNFTPAELDKILSKYFGANFVSWKLDIPNYGVVLDMGLLGSFNGTKLYLGVGTNLRNTRRHREKILKKLN